MDYQSTSQQLAAIQVESSRSTFQQISPRVRRIGQLHLVEFDSGLPKRSPHPRDAQARSQHGFSGMNQGPFQQWADRERQEQVHRHDERQSRQNVGPTNHVLRLIRQKNFVISQVLTAGM